MRALVVEDSPTQAEQIRLLLESEGYDAQTAPDGSAGLDRIDQSEFDVVISDILMPGISGYELCRRVRSDPKKRDTAIILLTTLNDPMDIIQGLECGADNFITKPYDPEHLIRRVRSIMDNRQMRSEGKLKLGIEVYFLGRTFTITSQKSQILDLLVSTFEEIIQTNRRLEERQAELAETYQGLNGLCRVAMALNEAKTVAEVTARTVERAMELPNVRAAWVTLLESDGTFRIAAAAGLPPGLQARGVLEGDCACRRMLLSEELIGSVNIIECDRLRCLGTEWNGPRTHACVPLWIGDRVLGSLNLVGLATGPFREDELRILHGVGNQVGTALERGRLRERLESRARITEEKYRHILEQADDGVLIADDRGVVIEVNRQAAAMLGRTTEEIIGDPFSDFVIDDQRDYVHRLQQSPAQEVRLRANDLFFKRPDGKVLCAEASIARVALSDQSLQLVILRDVTERRRTEAALRESDENQRMVLENIDEIVYRVTTPVDDSMRGEVHFVSPQVETLLGYAPEEFIKDRDLWFKLIHPEDLSAVITRTQEIVSGEMVGTRVYRIRDKFDGDYHWIEDRVVFKRVGSNSSLTMFGVARDVTERMRAEEARARLVAILEATPDFVATATPDGRAFYCNKSARRMLGIGDEVDLATVRIADGHPKWAEEAMLRDGLPSAIRDGLWTGESAFLAPDGREIPVSQLIVAHKARDGSLEYFSTIARDLTERKRLEEQIRQSQKMEAIGRLAGGIAHDFNNLLTAILGYSHLVEAELGVGHPLRGDVEQIRMAGERAAALTRQLLAFSRKQVLLPEVLDLNLVVTETEKMLRRLIGEDVELVTKLEPTLDRVKIDRSQIEQVIMNLAVNSRDAMPEGGRLTIETRNVHLDARLIWGDVPIEPGSYILLAVSDTGTGMDEATKSQIFEPFFTTKGQGKGTGLGLAMVYGIVRQSGGHVWVYSEVGEGTTFKIYLPREEGETRGARRRAELPAEQLMGTETVLVVEDDEAVRDLACGLLRSCGYTVVTSRTPEEAQENARDYSGQIHLLLTDVVMPGMSGSELARRVASIRPEIKVLFMSGYTDEAIGRHLEKHPGRALLEKPFTPPSLARRVRAVLDSGAD